MIGFLRGCFSEMRTLKEHWLSDSHWIIFRETAAALLVIRAFKKVGSVLNMCAG